MDFRVIYCAHFDYSCASSLNEQDISISCESCLNCLDPQNNHILRSKLWLQRLWSFAPVALIKLQAVCSSSRKPLMCVRACSFPPRKQHVSGSSEFPVSLTYLPCPHHTRRRASAFCFASCIPPTLFSHKRALTHATEPDFGAFALLEHLFLKPNSFVASLSLADRLPEEPPIQKNDKGMEWV